MSEDRVQEQGEALRGEVEQERQSAGGVHRWRCSGELRARVLAHAMRCVGDGESHTRIAERLGLAQPTLSRWMREGVVPGAAVRTVAIVPAGRPAGLRSGAPGASELRLRTPRGFVVEGLDLERLASLLRVLG